MFGAVGGSILGVYLFTRLSRLVSRQKIIQEHKAGVLLQILLPKYSTTTNTPGENVQSKARAGVAEQLFSELHALTITGWKKHFLYKQTVSFEIVATAEAIRFYCFCPAKLVSFVQNAVNAAYPEAEVTAVPQWEILSNSHLIEGVIQLKGPDYSPIRTLEVLASDPLNSILNKISHLKPGEMMVIQHLITPVSGTWRKHAYSFLNFLKNQLSSPKTTMLGQFGTGFKESVSGQTTVPSEPQNQTVDQKLYEEVEKKMSRPGFRVCIRLIAASPDKIHAQSNFENLARSYSMFDEPPLANFTYSQSFLTRWHFVSNFRLRLPPLIELPFARQQFVVNTTELATILHFPSMDVETPRIQWLAAKKAPAPTDMPPTGLFLGNNQYRGVTTRAFIAREDRRRHVYLVGQTGTGKSEYLKYLVLQDIKAGEGVCFVDPHGDAAEDILQKIPKERIVDTIYWNPADTEFPMGLNIMEAYTEEQKHILINSFIGLLYKLYDPNRTGIMGPMLERAIRNVMLTAMEEPGSTLIEALRLLTSPEYAETKVPYIKDPLVKTYWTEELAHTSDFHKSQTLGYFVSKFDRFVTDITIRNIIGQSKSAFDFRKIMDERKILIVNLSKGRLGEENSAFLGLLLIPKLLVASMARVDTPEEKRPDFYLYVDEFQNFATPDFAEIMSEARKYRLNLIVANQFIAQIQEQVRNAVFGNIGTLGAFRVGVDDAKYLASQFAPVFDEHDLTNNSIGNLYLKLLINGKPSVPFSVALNWNDISTVPTDTRIKQLITKMSQTKFGVPRLVIENEIVQRARLY